MAFGGIKIVQLVQHCGVDRRRTSDEGEGVDDCSQRDGIVEIVKQSEYKHIKLRRLAEIETHLQLV